MVRQVGRTQATELGASVDTLGRLRGGRGVRACSAARRHATPEASAAPHAGATSHVAGALAMRTHEATPHGGVPDALPAGAVGPEPSSDALPPGDSGWAFDPRKPFDVT